MHILIMNWRDIKNPRAGGAEIVTFEHAKRWVKAGHAVTWLTGGFTGGSTHESIEGVNIVRVARSYTLYLIAPFYYFFHRRDFDIVVDEVHGIPFYTPLYVTKPKIILIHEVAGDIWESMYPFPISYMGRLSEYVMFWLYRKIIFWTDAPSTVGELVSRGIARDHCVTIPCPITNQVLSKLPSKMKKLTFICVNRLVKMKGVEDIISAFALFMKMEPQSQLWIVGDGDSLYVSKLHELVKAKGILQNVTFWGRVSEKKKIELLGRAHILLHASIKEGWGLVVLEAASQGTPSIVYDVLGLRDTVKDNETGVIVKQNTPNELAQEAFRLIRDTTRYTGMQKQGLIWSRSMRWEKVAKQSLRLLNYVRTSKNISEINL